MNHYAKSMFTHIYYPGPNENIDMIAKKFGHTSSKAITGFARNLQESLRGRWSPNVSKKIIFNPGDKLYIPWRKKSLSMLIENSKILIANIEKSARFKIQQHQNNKERIDQLLNLLDLLNFTAGALVSCAMLARSAAAKTGAAVTASKSKLWFDLTKAAIKNLGIKGARSNPTPQNIEGIVFLVDHILTRWLGPGTKFLDEANKSTALKTKSNTRIPVPMRPKLTTLKVIGHMFGPWNPSWYAQVGGGFSEWDMDVVVHGSDYVQYRIAVKIRNNALSRIRELRRTIQAAGRQLRLPLYR